MIAYNIGVCMCVCYNYTSTTCLADKNFDGNYNNVIGQYKLYLSFLLIVLCIHLYLLLLPHPFISHYIPGMLKRMGMGMFMILISLVLVSSVVIVPDFASGTMS